MSNEKLNYLEKRINEQHNEINCMIVQIDYLTNKLKMIEEKLQKSDKICPGCIKNNKQKCPCWNFD